MALILISASAAWTPAISFTSSNLSHGMHWSADTPNVTCSPSNLPVRTTSFEQITATFYVDAVAAQQLEQDITLPSNHTLTVAVNFPTNAVKCQWTPDDCTIAMRSIRKTCEHPSLY